MNKFKVIDLFAGAGGLSLGFQKTGKFNIVAAVEKSDRAQETYKNNFERVDLWADIKEVNFNKILEKHGNIDVVIGGPPCQGFSNANRQHNYAINQNNKLVKEYIKAILALKPKAFVMENVGMLKSNIHRFYIEDADDDIVEKYGIKTEEAEIFLLSKEYDFDGVMDILKNCGRVQKNKWDSTLYKNINVLYKCIKNKEKLNQALERHCKSIVRLISEYKGADNSHVNGVNKKLFKLFSAYFEHEIDVDEFDDEFIIESDEAMAIQKMLNRAEEIYTNHIKAKVIGNGKSIVAKTYSCAVGDYLMRILESEQHGYAISADVLSAAQFGIPQKRKRFILIGVQKQYADKVELPVPSGEIQPATVRDAIGDLEDVPPYYTVQEDDKMGGNWLPASSQYKYGRLGSLRDTDGMVYNHIVTKTTDRALQRFEAIKEGQNFHSLKKEMIKDTYTNAQRTQNTIYLRLKYDEPSGTVVNVRKSMWIHPHKNRAVSVREAARLQTFPDSFRFYGPKDSQYQQVGNAVPPMLAEIIAEKIFSYISKK